MLPLAKDVITTKLNPSECVDGMFCGWILLVVEHLDANVTIQASSDQARDESEAVSNCLPAISADALVTWIVGIPEDVSTAFFVLT